jgi:hypothetical protein
MAPVASGIGPIEPARDGSGFGYAWADEPPHALSTSNLGLPILGETV